MQTPGMWCRARVNACTSSLTCVWWRLKCLCWWCLQKRSRHGEGAAICARVPPDVGLAADFMVFAQSVQTGNLCVFATAVLHSRLILVCCSLPVPTFIPSFVVSFGIPVMHICHRALVFCLGNVFCSFFSVVLIQLLHTPCLIRPFES